MKNSSSTKTTKIPQTSFTPSPRRLLQRQCARGSAAGLMRKCSECEQKKLTLQRRDRDHSETEQVPPIVHEVLQSPGQPLDSDTLTFMESSFGHDFSQVRVHTDAKAAESARAVNALAYTVGRDVIFETGQYAPETKAGKRLLAHELTHVVQQSGTKNETATDPSQVQRVKAPLAIGLANDQYEQEADRVARELIYSSTEGASDVPAIQTRHTFRVIRRQPQQNVQPTQAELRQMQLRQLAVLPGKALKQWNKLRQSEREEVLKAITTRYGEDFKTEFLEYAKGKKKPNFTIYLTNMPEATPANLIKKGYRYAGDIGGTPIWVRPSGEETWVLSQGKPGNSPNTPGNSPDTYEYGGVTYDRKTGKVKQYPKSLEDRCMLVCVNDTTKSEEECSDCCVENIPANDSGCLNFCIASCQDYFED